MKVTVEVERSMYMLRKTFDLVACPHHGDYIEVDGVTFLIEVAFIGSERVLVRSFDPVSAETSHLLRQLGWA